MVKSVLSFISVCLFVSSWAYANPLYTGHVPVLQGYTNQTESFITVLRDPDQTLEYSIAPEVDVKITSKHVGKNHFVDTLEVANLKPGVSYELTMKIPNGQVMDTRQFGSLNQTLSDPKVAICSCSRIGILSPDDKQRSMYDRLMDQKPSAIFFLGDLVYGDNAAQAVLKYLSLKIKKVFPRFPFYRPSFSYIQNRYISSWKKEKIYRQQNLIPMFSVWDDHDFGFDGADKNNPYKEKILELYRSYYPVAKESQVISRGPGASYSFNIFGKKVLMLDNRTFSSFADGIVLGDEQIRWIESQLKNQTEVVIASGMSITNLGDSEKSVERTAPTEWEKFRRIFLQNPDLRAVFLTGDVHYSEIRNIPEEVFGFKTTQIVSSHIHSTTPLITPPFRSGYDPKDPNQIQFVGGRNFAIVPLKSMFTQLKATFFRDGKKNPIAYVGEAQSTRNQCNEFYRHAL